MSESTDIQTLVDNATVANKRSRLQVFELNPARGKSTTIIDEKQQVRLLKVLFVVVLAAALAVLAVLPAQAEETSVLGRIRAKKQPVLVLDAQGNPQGYGEFRTQMSISRGGRISGKAVLELPSAAIQFHPTEFTIGKQNPWEVVLNGRFEVATDGGTQSSTGTVTIKEVVTSDPASSSSRTSSLVTGYDFVADFFPRITFVAVTELAASS